MTKRQTNYKKPQNSKETSNELSLAIGSYLLDPPTPPYPRWESELAGGDSLIEHALEIRMFNLFDWKLENAQSMLFLEDIDPIFKKLKKLLDGSLGFIGTCLFQQFRNVRYVVERLIFLKLIKVIWCLQN